MHGGENGVTLLIYEAHKALSKLHADGVQAGGAADEARENIAAALQDSAYCAGLQRGFMLGNQNDHDGLRQALESRDGYVKNITEVRAAPTSAPVAGEALFWYRPRSDGGYEGPIHNDRIEDQHKRSGAWVPLYTVPPPASVAVAVHPIMGG